MARVHVLTAVALVTACGGTRPSAHHPGSTTPAAVADLRPPASFAGRVPCADCPGIAVTLTLRADRLFLLRRSYLERTGAPVVELGRWHVSDDRRRLILTSGSGVQRFAIRSADTLRMLDTEGRPIDSRADNAIIRSPGIDSIAEPAELSGRYAYLADAGAFTECSTGRRWPVARAEDNRALEAGYLAARRQPGQSALVRLRGHLETSPNLDGTTREMLVVDRYEATDAAGDCPASRAPESEGTPLEETYWKVLEVRGRPVAVFDNGREAYLQFQAGDRVGGFGGCNRLFGGYTIAGDTLRLAALGSTRMACDQGMEQERSLLETLRLVTRYAIRRDTLSLFAADEPVARLEGRYLR